MFRTPSQHCLPEAATRSARGRGLRRWHVLLLAAILIVLGWLWPLGALAGMRADACERKPSLAAGGFAAAVARAAPAVVNVVVIRRSRNLDDETGRIDYFPPLSAAGPPAGAGTERSTSSGFILGADGVVIASAHSVHDALETWVLAADGRRWRAAVAGFDMRTDVAVLKVPADGLPVVPVAAGEPLCAGERVAAIGSPFGFDHSVSAGVVSAPRRFVPGGAGIPLIQTDVAINPGSSGGPLLNAAGAVVGMNSMIYSASGIYVGVSFALPISRVLRVAHELQSSGHAGAIDAGLSTQPVTSELAEAFGLDTVRGLLVVHTTTGGPAARAGIRTADIVLSLNGTDIEADADLDEQMAAQPPGQPMILRFWRQGAAHATSLALERSAPAVPGAAVAPGAAEKRLGLNLAAAPAVAAMPSGVYVDSASGSALLAGVEAGDRIVAVNGSAVADEREFEVALARAGQRRVVALLIMRGNVALFLPVRRRDR